MALHTNEPCLNVEILSAKGLKISPSQQYQQHVNYLQLHILYHHQVIRSSPTLTLTKVDPVFNYSCNFPLSNLELMTSSSLLHIEEPILIYITTTTTGLTTTSSPFGIHGLNKSLIAAAVLDFRYSLISLQNNNNEYISVELLPCDIDGIHMGVSAGIIYAKLQLINLPLLILENSKNLLQGEENIEDYIYHYQNKIAQENRVLYSIARNWWNSAITTYPYLKNHIFKIITEDELGYHRSVCSLLAPITPHRSIINPKFSARYVSLIPFRRDIGLTGGRVETWRSSHAMMCRQQGDVEDHAILLCSMLMGWGLDAWIGLGTIVSLSDTTTAASTATPTTTVTGPPKEYIHRPYCWVITFDRSSNDTTEDNEPKVIFWEAVSGKQYEIPHYQTTINSQYKPHVFGELHALFKNDCYLINIQQNCLINGGYFAADQRLHHRHSDQNNPSSTGKKSQNNYMSFDLSNERYFLSFPQHAISPILLHPGSGIEMKMNPIYPPIVLESQMESSPSPSSSSSTTTEPPRITFCKTQLMNSECLHELEFYIEEKLRDVIATFRLTKELYTHYDTKLSIILQSTLTSYEWNRAMNISFGNTEFQMSIKNQVKSGEYFKAYPTCFCHLNYDLIGQQLCETNAALDILLTNDRESRFGVSCKLFPYPDGVISFWIMIAVCAEK